MNQTDTDLLAAVTTIETNVSTLLADSVTENAAIAKLLEPAAADPNVKAAIDRLNSQGAVLAAGDAAIKSTLATIPGTAAAAAPPAAATPAPPPATGS